MAKLQASETAGWNAGRSFYAKIVPIEEVVVDPEISNIFVYKDYIREIITDNIRQDGFDKSQPITVMKTERGYVVLDGHTRLAAAAAAGLSEVPIAVMEAIKDKEDAILYTYERQIARRNLTTGEVFHAVELMMALPGQMKKAANGKGRNADKIAARLGVSASTIYRAEKVIREGSEDQINRMRGGETTVGKVCAEIDKPKAAARKKSAESASNDEWLEAELARERAARERPKENGEAARIVDEALAALRGGAPGAAELAIGLLERLKELISFETN